MQQMMSPPDEPVLSEVHMESCPPDATSWCTRFCYSLPQQPQQPPNNSRQQLSHCSPAVAAASLAEARIPAGDSLTYSLPDDHAAGIAEPDLDVQVDADGDLLLLSRPARRSCHISIQHSLATPVSRCGEQVWLGSCLLCDWLLHNAQQLAGQTVLELGAGIGLASIMAAQLAEHVLLTDADGGALELAACNVTANGVQERVSVRRLDWLQLFDTQLCRCSDAEVLLLLNSTSKGSGSGTATRVSQAADTDEAGQGSCRGQKLLNDSSYAWQCADLQQLCAVDTWLAADVVYNETLTDAFMRTAYQLMAWQQQQRRRQQELGHQHQECIDGCAPCCDPADGKPGHAGKCGCSMQGPRLLVAVEKRYNFTYRDLDARAGAFEHFKTYVVPAAAAAAVAGTKDLFCQQQVQQTACGAQQQAQQQQQQVQLDRSGPLAADLSTPLRSNALFSGRRLTVSELPQAMVYDRSADLELWELLPLLPAVASSG